MLYIFNREETEKSPKQAGQEEKPQTQTPVDVASTGIVLISRNHA